MNWTSAVTHTDGPLAKICSQNQLQEAQRELEENTSYWTALKRSRAGTYQWGFLNNETFNVAETSLLDESEDGKCYIVSKHSMKLKAIECNSSHNVVFAYDEDNGKVREKSVEDILNRRSNDLFTR